MNSRLLILAAATALAGGGLTVPASISYKGSGPWYTCIPQSCSQTDTRFKTFDACDKYRRSMGSEWKPCERAW